VNKAAYSFDRNQSTAKLTPEAQPKLDKLLLETTQVLKERAGKGGADMSMEHHDSYSYGRRVHQNRQPYA